MLLVLIGPRGPGGRQWLFILAPASVLIMASIMGAVAKLLLEDTLCRPFYNPCAACRSLATVSIISYPTCARGIIIKWSTENDDIVNTDYCLLFS